jgi:hypothetical protein
MYTSNIINIIRLFVNILLAKKGDNMKFRIMLVFSVLLYMLVLMYDVIVYICYNHKSIVADIFLFVLIFPLYIIGGLAQREVEKKRRK